MSFFSLLINNFLLILRMSCKLTDLIPVNLRLNSNIDSILNFSHKFKHNFSKHDFIFVHLQLSVYEIISL